MTIVNQVIMNVNFVAGCLFLLRLSMITFTLCFVIVIEIIDTAIVVFDRLLRDFFEVTYNNRLKSRTSQSLPGTARTLSRDIVETTYA